MPWPNFPPPDDGFNYWSVLIGLLMALWGGLVSYLGKIRRQLSNFNFVDLFVELITCSFAGLIVFVIAIWFDVPEYPAAAFAGLGGHAGARTIFVFQDAILRRVKKLFEGCP